MRRNGLVASVTSGLVRSVVRSVAPSESAAAPPAFDPASLFGSGEAGGAWAMTAANLFQLSTGSTAVVNGDPVGYVADLSGNGKHLLQATSGKRPTYVESGGVAYLDFDGIDDAMASSSLTMSSSSALTLVIAWAPVSVTGTVVPLEARGYNAAGTWSIYAGVFGANTLAFQTESGSSIISGVTGSTRVVHSACINRSAATVAEEIALKVNGVASGSAGGSAVTGANADYILDVGARSGSSFYSGMEVSALLLINRLLTSEELANAEAWAAGYAGVTL